MSVSLLGTTKHSSATVSTLGNKVVKLSAVSTAIASFGMGLCSGLLMWNVESMGKVFGVYWECLRRETSMTEMMANAYHLRVLRNVTTLFTCYPFFFNF